MAEQEVGVRLGDLARRVGAQLRGDPDVRVTRVAALDQAGPEAVAFLNSASFRPHLERTRAGAVVLGAADLAACPTAALVTANPYLAFARIAAELHPAPAGVAGVHPSAFVDPAAVLGEGVEVGPQAVVLAGARVGARSVLAAGAHVGRQAVLGADCRIGVHAVVGDRVTVGERALLHAGVVLGSDGFGFAPDRGSWVKVPQLGRVVVGDDVEIGANSAVDRGALGDTVIENGVKLDNLVHVAHNCRIGAHTVIAAGVGIAGSTTIGRHCAIAGMAGLAGHLSIADGVTIMGMTRVSHSIGEAGAYSSGTPLAPVRNWRRNAVRFSRLDDMYHRLRELETELAALKAKQDRK